MDTRVRFYLTNGIISLSESEELIGMDVDEVEPRFFVSFSSLSLTAYNLRLPTFQNLSPDNAMCEIQIQYF